MKGKLTITVENNRVVINYRDFAASLREKETMLELIVADINREWEPGMAIEHEEKTNETNHRDNTSRS
jgi:hypothetical protein